MELGPPRRSGVDESVPARRPRWLGLALFCGIAPLALGTACYLGWQATRAAGFEVAGLFVLLFGGILFITGWVALVAYVASTPAVHADERRNRLFGTLFAAVLLAAQVPALVFALNGVAEARESYRLQVKNESSSEVLGLVVWGPNLSLRLGNVAPKRSETFEIALEREGTLHYEAAWRKQLLEGVLDSRAARGGSVTLRVQEDGKVLLLRRGD